MANYRLFKQKNRLSTNSRYYRHPWPPWILRKIVPIAISQKRHFRSQFRNSENTFQYKLPPKTWEKSPQKPLSATRKWFFGHCYVQNANFLKILSPPDFCTFMGWMWSPRRVKNHQLHRRSFSSRLGPLLGQCEASSKYRCLSLS